MAILSKLLVALGLDASDYQKGLDAVKTATADKIGQIGGTLQDVGSSARRFGGMLSLGVTTPLVAMGVKAIDAASDLDESMNKVQVVFGDAAEQIVAFAATSATALGQSQQQALEAAGTFGNLFTAMGIGVDASAEMSTSLVTLASDLASFNNITPDEALIALRAGLVGEAEPLRRLGVNLNAAAIAAKAMELGLTDVAVDMTKVQGLTLDLEKAQAKAAEAMKQFGADSIEARQANQAAAEVQERLNAALAGSAEALTPAQKAQAAYALILEQTTAAQGDFVRTSDGLANSTRIMRAQLSDAAATLGAQLLPVGLQVVNFVSGLIAKFQALSPETQKIILIVGGLAAAIGPVLVVLGSLASAVGGILSVISVVGPVIGGIVGVLGGPVLAVIAAVVAAILLFKAAWDTNFLGIRDTLTAIWEGTLKPALEALWVWIQTTIPVALQWLATVWNTVLLPAITAVWSFLQTYVIPLLGALANVWIAIVKKELEILAGIWQNVLRPAIGAVINFIVADVIPVLGEMADFVGDTLGPALDWLGGIIDAVSGAFDALGAAIASVVNWLKELAAKIASIQLPSWMTPGSPTPLELGLLGIGRAMAGLATDAIPALNRALAGMGPVGLAAAVGEQVDRALGHLGELRATAAAWTWPEVPAWPALSLAPAVAPAFRLEARDVAGMAAGQTMDGGRWTAGNGQPAAGDTFIIHNHNPLAAALTNAMVEERRRARLNSRM